jgi:hypothetical protein
MGVAELNDGIKILTLRANMYFYGNAANADISSQVAKNIEDDWNEPEATVLIQRNIYRVLFDIKGFYDPALLPSIVIQNTNPYNNYFRVEEYAFGNISFVDGIGSNTGYFKLENLLNNSTTAAHEYGHTIGLEHPNHLDIRGQGVPGIMYPRGTIVDPQFQYDPATPAGQTGGTMNPFTRKVKQKDIDHLKLNKLNFNKDGKAIVGGFSSVWHEAQFEKNKNSF